VPFAAYGSLKKYADGTNPMLTMALDNDLTVTNRILGNISPSLTLAKRLVYNPNFGLDNSSSSRDLRSLPNAEPLVLGGLTSIEYKNTNRLIENYLTYTFSKDVHSLTTLAGHMYEKIFL